MQKLRRTVTIQQWRELEIFNVVDLIKAAGAKLVICYHAAETGRMSRCANWAVIGNGFQTKPDAHFMDYGTKKFIVWGRNTKAPALEEAKQWVAETYQITEWEKGPFGGIYPKGTVKKALENIKKKPLTTPSVID